MKQLYLIEFESAHWCGGRSNCVVLAENEQAAEKAADVHMSETMLELFDSDDEDASEYVVNSVEVFTHDHEDWKYFIDNTQREHFYPCVNFYYEDL